MSTPDAVRAFAAVPLPPGGTAGWKAWTQRAAALGAEAAPTLLEILRHGTETEQDVALIALRYVGYEAWADGYERSTTYRYRKIGSMDWTVVVPLHPPEPLDPGA